MSLNLSDDEIHGLIAYARDKFGDERYPFARCGRPGSPRQARPEADARTLAATEAICAEPIAAKEEQAAALSLRLGIRL
jgi:hypothetical protein